MQTELAQAVDSCSPAPPGVVLRAALLDSRQRWRDLVAISADFAWETDKDGRLSFVWPAAAFGWPASSLVGQPARTLLASPDVGFDPFAPGATFRDRRAWVRTASGGSVLLGFSAVPTPDGEGMRGIATDLTQQEHLAAELAGSLRRAELMDHIVGCMREELLAPRMISTMLRTAAQALGTAGAAVVAYGAERPAATHDSAPVPGAVVEMAVEALSKEDRVAVAFGREHMLIACPVPARFGERAGLVFWRDAASRVWDADDQALAVCLTGVVRVVIEQDLVQHEMARQARTDPLTGLLNRRAFAEELRRRLARLSGEGEHGTLIYLDLDRFKPINDRLGHEAGDDALLATARVLRQVFRPSDLIARLGGDEFAVWLDGADELTAAERAEDLRRCVPAAVAEALPDEAPAVTASMGIAHRRAEDDEEVDELLRRADGAMFAAKHSGRGQWQVAPARMCP